MEWESMTPILHPMEARVLFAMFHGCDTQRAVCAALGKAPATINEEFRAVERLGYVYWDDFSKTWKRTMSWDEAIEDLRKRAESHLRGTLGAIEDLKHVEPWWHDNGEE